MAGCPWALAVALVSAGALAGAARAQGDSPASPDTAEERVDAPRGGAPQRIALWVQDAAGNVDDGRSLALREAAAGLSDALLWIAHEEITAARRESGCHLELADCRTALGTRLAADGLVWVTPTGEDLFLWRAFSLQGGWHKGPASLALPREARARREEVLGWLRQVWLPAESMGTLRLWVPPGTRSARVDGVLWARAAPDAAEGSPLAGAWVERPLPAGLHEVALEHTGGATDTRWVRVAPGDEVALAGGERETSAAEATGPSAAFVTAAPGTFSPRRPSLTLREGLLWGAGASTLAGAAGVWAFSRVWMDAPYASRPTPDQVAARLAWVERSHWVAGALGLVGVGTLVGAWLLGGEPQSHRSADVEMSP